MKKITKIRIGNFIVLVVAYVVGISVLLSDSQLTSRQGRLIRGLIGTAILVPLALIIVGTATHKRDKKIGSTWAALKATILAVLSVSIFYDHAKSTKSKRGDSKFMAKKIIPDKVAIRRFKVSSVLSLLFGAISIFVFGWLSLLGVGAGIVFVSIARHDALKLIKYKKIYFIAGVAGSIISFVNMIIYTSI